MKDKVLYNILTDIKNGEKNAFDKLYKHTNKLVYYLAYNLTSNHDDVEDIVQESFIAINKNLHKLESIEAFNVWLNRIVINTGLNVLRKNKRIEVSLNNEDVLSSIALVDEYIENNPSRKLATSERQDEVMKIIDMLPVKSRLAVIMFYYEGFKISEIAQSLECSETAVNNRLLYAKKKLKEFALKYEETYNTKLYSIGIISALPTVLANNRDSVLKARTKNKVKINKGLNNALIVSVVSINIVAATFVYINFSNRFEVNPTIFTKPNTNNIKVEFDAKPTSSMPNLSTLERFVTKEGASYLKDTSLHNEKTYNELININQFKEFTTYENIPIYQKQMWGKDMYIIYLNDEIKYVIYDITTVNEPVKDLTQK